jgi:glycosyltransferase involved in cell wall biosynthesis
MKKPHVFIIVPSLQSTGPVKGALALARGLAPHFPTYLVDLKPAAQSSVVNCDGVENLSLKHAGRLKSKKAKFRSLVEDADPRSRNTVALSMCFSADRFVRQMAGQMTIISNVRGNLFQNYRYDYGIPGILLACLHYGILRRFHTVVAMSGAMAEQLRKLGIKNISIIGNFVDEPALDQCRKEVHRSGPPRFIFLGSMSRRKRPDLVLKAALELKKNSIPCIFDMVGSGPLKKALENQAMEMGLGQILTFHGHLSTPYHLIQKADFMVLPSESEGISRAVLEALYLGTPCIVRDIDANEEVITNGQNGVLFSTDDQFTNMIREAASQIDVTRRRKTTILLPDQFRMQNSIDQYRKLIER